MALILPLWRSRMLNSSVTPLKAGGEGRGKAAAVQVGWICKDPIKIEARMAAVNPRIGKMRAASCTEWRTDGCETLRSPHQMATFNIQQILECMHLPKQHLECHARNKQGVPHCCSALSARPHLGVRPGCPLDP